MRPSVFGFTAIILFAAFPTGAPAQKPARKRQDKIDPAPLASAAAAGKAHLRVWKTDLPGISSLDVIRQPIAGAENRKSTGQAIATTGPGYQFADYVETPAGRCLLASYASGQESAFSRIPTDLAADSYVTLLITLPKADSAPKAELIVDMEADGKIADATPQLAIFNLAPDVKDIRVTVGQELSAHLTATGSSLRMEGLPSGIYEVHTKGKDSKGNPFDWTTEGNFERFRRQTLLIYPDAYGRIRPRLNVDGPVPPELPTKSDTQS